jgi:hypothetical protein
LDGLDPQAESKVFALGITQLPAQFLVIPLFQHFQIEWNTSRQVLHIVSVTLNVRSSFDNARSYGSRGREAELEHFGKDFGKPVLLVFRHMSHANVVKIDLVRLV